MAEISASIKIKGNRPRQMASLDKSFKAIERRMNQKLKILNQGTDRAAKLARKQNSLFLAAHTTLGRYYINALYEQDKANNRKER